MSKLLLDLPDDVHNTLKEITSWRDTENTVTGIILEAVNDYLYKIGIK
jgi:hypothetical protein